MTAFFVATAAVLDDGQIQDARRDAHASQLGGS